MFLGISPIDKNLSLKLKRQLLKNHHKLFSSFSPKQIHTTKQTPHVHGKILWNNEIFCDLNSIAEIEFLSGIVRFYIISRTFKFNCQALQIWTLSLQKKIKNFSVTKLYKFSFLNEDYNFKTLWRRKKQFWLAIMQFSVNNTQTDPFGWKWRLQRQFLDNG